MHNQSYMPQLNSAFCKVDIKALKQVDELFDELVAQSQVITPAKQKPKTSKSTEGRLQVSIYIQYIQLLSNVFLLVWGEETHSRILQGAPMALFFTAGLSRGQEWQWAPVL